MILGIGAGVGFGQMVPKQQSKIIMMDSFNRANSTSLGTTETGQTWGGKRNSGMGISNNQAYPVANYSASFVDVPTQTDYRLTIDVPVVNEGRVYFKALNADNSHLRLQFSTTGGMVYLYQQTASLTSLGIFTANDGDHYEIVCQGNTIKVYQNGVLRINTTYDSALNANAGVGLAGWNNTNARFDNLKVEGL